MNNTITQTDSSQTVDTKKQSVQEILLEQLSLENPIYEVARKSKGEKRNPSELSEIVESVEEMVQEGCKLEFAITQLLKFAYIKQGRTDYAINESFQTLIDKELATSVFNLHTELAKNASNNIKDVKKGKDESRALISYTDVASWKDKDSNLQLKGTVPILVTVHLKLDHKKAINIKDSDGNKVVVTKDNKFQVIQEETTKETK
tara:strand:+ start:160 stop:771 length:612 start_codon:yes stop_codon:yes gene_type:complete